MPDIPMRILGRTGLRVTALGFGALELRGMVAGSACPYAGPARAHPQRCLDVRHQLH